MLGKGLDMGKTVDTCMLKARYKFLLLLFNVKLQVVLQIKEASLEKLYTQLPESHNFEFVKTLQ